MSNETMQQAQFQEPFWSKATPVWALILSIMIALAGLVGYVNDIRQQASISSVQIAEIQKWHSDSESRREERIKERISLNSHLATMENRLGWIEKALEKRGIVP